MIHSPEHLEFQIGFKLLELTKPSLATHYLIKKKTHSFLTQQLNAFYPLKDLRSILFCKFPSESLNLSRSFLKCFIIFTYYLILYLFYFYLFPGILEFWCLVTVTFKFTVLYNNIYIYKNIQLTLLLVP